MKEHYQFKSCDLKVKDIDTTGRKVVLYASQFGSVDSDGDMMIPGCYKKSIMENGPASAKPRIKHLRQHKVERIIGKPLEMKEDAIGLYCVSEIAKTTEGEDALELYKMDLFEHSVGFYTVKGESQTGHYAILEAKLFEYSSVTWGANENTPLVGIKSLNKENALLKLNERMNKLVQAIRKGKLTDESFELLDLELKQIQQAYTDIIESLKETKNDLS